MPVPPNKCAIKVDKCGDTKLSQLLFAIILPWSSEWTWNPWHQLSAWKGHAIWMNGTVPVERVLLTGELMYTPWLQNGVEKGSKYSDWMDKKTTPRNERHPNHVLLDDEGGLLSLSTGHVGQGSCNKSQSQIYENLTDDANFYGKVTECHTANQQWRIQFDTQAELHSSEHEM